MSLTQMGVEKIIKNKQKLAIKNANCDTLKNVLHNKRQNMSAHVRKKNLKKS